MLTIQIQQIVLYRGGKKYCSQNIYHSIRQDSEDWIKFPRSLDYTDQAKAIGFQNSAFQLQFVQKFALMCI